MNDQEFAFEIGQKVDELKELLQKARKTGLSVIVYPSYEASGGVNVQVSRTFNFPVNSSQGKGI